MDWCLEVRTWAEDNLCSSCLLKSISTTLHRVMHDTCKMHGKDIKTRSHCICKSWKIEKWREIVWKAIFVSSSTTEDHFWNTISIGIKEMIRVLQLNIDQSGEFVQQSLGETLQSGSSKPTQSPKPIEDRTGKPVTQEIVSVLQGEPSSSDRPEKPETKEEQHVRNHDGSGKPDGEEKLHKMQEDCHLKNRDDTDKFSLATDDENIVFNISGIPDEAVKRSQNFDILDLIQRIASHPQQEAVQNDLEQQQSFNAFSDESKVAIVDAGNIEISEIVTVEPKWQCKGCLKHCSKGVVCCTCGHLMTKVSAENRKYISAVLDTFSMANFYMRKHRPHGHKHGKAPGCKHCWTANHLEKKRRKKKYDSIHDRYIRDKTFRNSMIEVGRSEQMIKEMDKLASEDHTCKTNKEEIEFYRGNWFRTHKVRTGIQECVVTNATPEANREQKETRNIGTKFLILVFLALACKLVGVWFWALASKMVWPLITQGNLHLGGSISICGKSLNVQKNKEFLPWINRLQLTAVYCHRRGM